MCIRDSQKWCPGTPENAENPEKMDSWRTWKSQALQFVLDIILKILMIQAYSSGVQMII